jgi:heterodisulfide reductase subunit A
LNKQPSVLVIGGGIAGIQASLDLANRGIRVYLVEKNPSIGGRMAQLDKTFPTMDCSICILAPKMVECSRHPNITLLTYSELKDVKGSVGNFVVAVLKKPRYVDETKCTGCGQCEENCPIEIPNEFDERLGMRKAIYTPFPQAVPKVATVDKENCIECGLCEKVCKAGAVDLNQQPEEVELNVGAIIVATGFNLFNPSVIKEYGYTKYGNVLTSLELERMVCASGPTGGHLIRPSDGKIAHKIAFIQCVGSRGLKRGLPYCSSACCMYATKEALIIKEHDQECEVYIFYIELKVFGKGFQDFINKAKTEYDVKYIRARPGEIKENPMTKDLVIRYENTLTKKAEEMKADLVVLCPAMIPTGGELAKILRVKIDEYGFFKAKDSTLTPVDTGVPGIFVCGYCQEPKDIPESVAQASGAAARAAEAIEAVTKAAEAIVMVRG